jgi:hypothetical protein
MDTSVDVLTLQLLKLAHINNTQPFSNILPIANRLRNIPYDETLCLHLRQKISQSCDM